MIREVVMTTPGDEAGMRQSDFHIRPMGEGFRGPTLDIEMVNPHAQPYDLDRVEGSLRCLTIAEARTLCRALSQALGEEVS